MMPLMVPSPTRVAGLHLPQAQGVDKEAEEGMVLGGQTQGAQGAVSPGDKGRGMANG